MLFFNSLSGGRVPEGGGELERGTDNGGCVVYEGVRKGGTRDFCVEVLEVLLGV